MSKKVIKDTEWVKEQIPVKLDDDGNVVNKETGEPFGKKIFDMVGEGEPTKDMNPNKKGVLYFDKTSGIIWVCVDNEEDDNVWKSNTGKFINSTVDILDIFGDGSCIALYKLDGNADDVGGEYDGAWDGNEDYDDGKFGKGANTTKDDGNIILGKDVFSDGDKISVSLWVNFLEDEDNNSLTFTKYDGDNDYRFLFSRRDSKLGIFNGNNYDWKSGSDLDLNTIYHIAFTVSDDETKIFLNGELDFTVDKTTRFDDDTNIRLGYSDYNDFGANQIIDQVRIFDRTLTEDEVKELYKEGGN